jgi:hypothetical protein
MPSTDNCKENVTIFLLQEQIFKKKKMRKELHMILHGSPNSAWESQKSFNEELFMCFLRVCRREEREKEEKKIDK